MQAGPRRVAGVGVVVVVDVVGNKTRASQTQFVETPVAERHPDHVQIVHAE